MPEHLIEVEDEILILKSVLLRIDEKILSNTLLVNGLARISSITHLLTTFNIDLGNLDNLEALRSLSIGIPLNDYRKVVQSFILFIQELSCF